MRHAFKLIVSKFSYATLEEASNVLLAMQLLNLKQRKEETKFDFLFISINMSIVSGVEIAKNIK